MQLCWRKPNWWEPLGRILLSIWATWKCGFDKSGPKRYEKFQTFFSISFFCQGYFSYFHSNLMSNVVNCWPSTKCSCTINSWSQSSIKSTQSLRPPSWPPTETTITSQQTRPRCLITTTLLLHHHHRFTTKNDEKPHVHPPSGPPLSPRTLPTIFRLRII